MAFSSSNYSALSARAYAQQIWPSIGFQDHAAKTLAKLLGVTAPLKTDLTWERTCLWRSQWFDEQCRHFFMRYPQAMCIDLGAGLSTRFHRLSEVDDWPRFSWVDVDLPEVTAIKANALPRIDNYRLLAADIIKEDWLAASGWHPRTPLIVTFESVLMVMNGRDIGDIFATIVKHCSPASTIEIVFDYPKLKNHWYDFVIPNSSVLALRYVADSMTALGLTLKFSDPLKVPAECKNEQFFICKFSK